MPYQGFVADGSAEGKVATMKWDDLVDGEWRIPSEPREKSNAGNLRLPQVVLGIVEAQPRMATNPYVFAAGHGNGAFNLFAAQGRARREAAQKVTTYD